jgi:hypothetical protein
MSKIATQIMVEPNTLAVGMGVAKLVSDVKAALKSGKPVEEAVAIASALLTDLVPVIGNISQISVELADDKLAFQGSIAMTSLAIEQAILL